MIWNWRIVVPNKMAAHGDMSRQVGRGIEILLEAFLQGSSTIYYHYVACQVIFLFLGINKNFAEYCKKDDLNSFFVNGTGK